MNQAICFLSEYTEINIFLSLRVYLFGVCDAVTCFPVTR